MDINQKKLKTLLVKTDNAFESYKQHPSSEDYAQAYEEAKNALDAYTSEIRLLLQQRTKKK